MWKWKKKCSYLFPFLSARWKFLRNRSFSQLGTLSRGTYFWGIFLGNSSLSASVHWIFPSQFALVVWVSDLRHLIRGNQWSITRKVYFLRVPSWLANSMNRIDIYSWCHPVENFHEYKYTTITCFIVTGDTLYRF